MDWKRKIALVTGASSGIGLEVARKLVGRGVRVALVARSVEKLKEVERELGGEVACAFPLDVTDRAGVLALPGRVVERFGGRIDFVINNAGANHRGEFAERSAGELEQILETNLVAPVLLTRAALEHLAAGAVVVNVASLAGKVPVPHEAAYCASKAGLRAFGRALDVELAGKVRFCAVCPGPVDTGFLGVDLARVPDLVLSQPVSTAAEVADAVIRALEGDAREIDVPAVSGKLATLGYLFPGLFRVLRPLLRRRGVVNRRKLAAARERARLSEAGGRAR